MSLLGPDDFDLTGKGRKKKLAKDLSPAVQKEIEKWLDKIEDPAALGRLTDLVGPEDARRMFAQRRARLKRKPIRDSLMDEE